MTNAIHRISVSRRLTLFSVLSTAGALVVAGLGFVYLDLRSTQRAYDDQIELQADLLMPILAPLVESDDEEAADEAILVFERIPAAAGAEILFQDGRRLAGFGELPSDHNPRSVIQRQFVLADGRTATLTIDSHRVFDAQRLLRLGVALFFLSLLAMIVSYFVSRKLKTVIALPIEHLARRMRDVSERHDYSVRAESGAEDEVGELVDVFNEMLTQIEFSEHELQGAKNSLELSVDRRTGELQQEIRRRKTVEAELIEARDRAERLGVAKAEFLTNMSHEIRTPLIGVIGIAELLEDTPLDELQKEYVETLVGSSSHLLLLVNDILDASRLNAGDMTVEAVRFDLADLSYEVATLLYHQARDKGLDVAIGYPSTVPRQVEGDPARVRQLLTNLLGNAIKFTEQGSIAIMYELVQEDGERCVLRMTVEDTGVGIPEDKMARIFEHFSQADMSSKRSHGGVGLGLAIAKSLVDLMDGGIECKSQVGVGTRLEVELPFGIVERPRELLWPRSNWGSTHAILAMGDGLPAQLLKAKLEEFGLRVTRVSAPGSADFQECAEDLGAGQGLPALLFADAGDEPERTLEILRRLSAELGDRSPWYVLLADHVQIRGDTQLHHLIGGSVLRKPARHADIVRLLDLVAHEELPPAADPGQPRVLLAEDNLVNQRICQSMLERCGFHVSCVADGDEAVEAAAAESFDLILMDCHMPKMDGLRATRAIRQTEGEGAESLVIGLLSSDRGALEDSCRRAGMNEIVSKPITMAKLETLCARHFPLVTP